VEITRKGTIRDIKTIEEEFCCNDMKNAWNDFVVWGGFASKVAPANKVSRLQRK
jgi:hypothetical protein